jgi:hypothetical protein
MFFYFTRQRVQFSHEHAAFFYSGTEESGGLRAKKKALRAENKKQGSRLTF